MGSSNKKDWECFLSEAKKYSNLIFVVSAGNNKQNIDIKPIYPASFDLKNIITVSSSTKNGQLGRDSNYGFKNVDFLNENQRFPMCFCLKNKIFHANYTIFCKQMHDFQCIL